MYTYTFIEKVLFRFPSFEMLKLKPTLDRKTILITGASSGIGQAFAYLLADTTTHLILVARREADMRVMKTEIEKASARVTVFSADLRNEEEREGLLTYLQQLPDGLDVVVSNAGISINRPIVESLDRYHDFTRTMAINYFAPVQLILALIPLLEQKNGHIVNVSTINALLHPIPHWAAYQASKTAFDTWFRSAGPELAIKNISTTTLYLPLVKTPMIKPTMAYDHSPAMSPVHVAELIGHALYTKRTVYKPWWLFLGQGASLVFRGPLERGVLQFLKKKERDSKHG